jgi:phenylpropionate dioxygenase-like ring-hydroxylating dioxygenase large terminal subunit
MALIEKPTVGNRSSGPTAQEIMATDAVLPPKTLRVESQFDMGTADIPVEQYFSREWHDLEVERVWKRVWQVAAREDDLPGVGDTLVYDIADLSFLLVRSAPDTIKGYYNACLHRGTQLRDRDGYAPELRCPFHGWTWNLDGSLKTMPCRWDFDHLNDEELALPEIKVGNWGGWVFINPDPDAISLEEYLGTFPEHFIWDTAKRYKSLHVSKLLRVNWKACLEAFIESYHVIATHPQILTYLGDANTQYDVFPGTGPGRPGWNRMNTLSGVSSPHLGAQLPQDEILAAQLGSYGLEAPPVPEGETARRVLAATTRSMFDTKPASIPGEEVSDSEAIDNILYYVFPNFQPWAGLSPINYRFRPNGNDPDSCIMDVMFLADYEGEEKPKSAKVIHLGFDDDWTDVEELGTLAMVFNQDVGNLPRVQRGLHTMKKPGISLGRYQESRVRQIHHELDYWINQKP